MSERGHQCELALPGNSRKTINDRKKTEEKRTCIYKAFHKKGILSDKKNIIKKWEGKSSLSSCGILNHIMVSIQLDNWFEKVLGQHYICLFVSFNQSPSRSQ